ncbi:MAG: hypothetical protein R3F59_01065 [Myxococcota bacterium]
MAKVRAVQKRGKAIKGGQTAMLSAEEVAEMAADLQEARRPPAAPPRRGPAPTAPTTTPAARGGRARPAAAA